MVIDNHCSSRLVGQEIISHYRVTTHDKKAYSFQLALNNAFNTNYLRIIMMMCLLSNVVDDIITYRSLTSVVIVYRLTAMFNVCNNLAPSNGPGKHCYISGRGTKVKQRDSRRCYYHRLGNHR